MMAIRLTGKPRHRVCHQLDLLLLQDQYANLTKTADSFSDSEKVVLTTNQAIEVRRIPVGGRHGSRACLFCFFFFSSRRRHTRFKCDWSSDVCSSDLNTTSSASSARRGSTWWRRSRPT